MKRQTGYLLIGRGPSPEIFKSKQTAGKGPVAACLPEKKAVTQSLRSLTARGAQIIFVVPVARLSKRAAVHDIPLAIEQFRRKNLNLDFHYTCVRKQILDVGSWIMDNRSKIQDPKAGIQ